MAALWLRTLGIGYGTIDAIADGPGLGRQAQQARNDASVWLADLGCTAHQAMLLLQFFGARRPFDVVWLASDFHGPS